MADLYHASDRAEETKLRFYLKAQLNKNLPVVGKPLHAVIKIAIHPPGTCSGHTDEPARVTDTLPTPRAELAGL